MNASIRALEQVAGAMGLDLDHFVRRPAVPVRNGGSEEVEQDAQSVDTARSEATTSERRVGDALNRR